MKSLMLTIFFCLLITHIHIFAQDYGECFTSPPEEKFKTSYEKTIYDLECINSKMTKSYLWSIDDADTIHNHYFIPTPETPIKYVRVNINVIQDENGENNFNQNNPDHMTYLNSLFSETWSESVNGRMENIQAPRYGGETGDPYIEDSRIRYSVEGIHFHQDDGGLDEINGTGHHVFFSYCRENFVINMETEINIFLIPTGYHGELGNVVVGGTARMGLPYPYSDPPRIGKVIMYNIFTNYEENPNENYPYGGTHYTVNPLIAHELGHIFGLGHTFVRHDNPNPPCQHYEYLRFYPELYCPEYSGWCCPDEDDYCSNNMMGYNKNKTWLSPLQIGHIHRVLSSNPARTRYLKNIKQVDPGDIVVSQDTVWSMPTVGSLDIIINPGKTLEISCMLTMLDDCDIIIHDGGKLIVTGILNMGKRGEIVIGNNSALVVEGNLNLPWMNLVFNLFDGGTILLSSNSSTEIDIYSKIITWPFFGYPYFCLEDGAHVNLVDSSSAIDLHSGYINGVNTNILPPSNDCVTFPGRYTVYGNGKINDFNDLYIQNETITTNQDYAARNIFVGHFVTNSMPPGDVVITNNSHVTFSPENFILFDTGFKITLGSSMELIPSN